MKVTYPPNTICVRCGTDRKHALQHCATWGMRYPRHMWNKEKLRIETQIIGSAIGV